MKTRRLVVERRARKCVVAESIRRLIKPVKRESAVGAIIVPYTERYVTVFPGVIARKSGRSSCKRSCARRFRLDGPRARAMTLII